MLHDLLWEQNRDLIEACLAHPFIRALAEGGLDQAAFRRYVAQDAFFLEAFFRAYALAAAKAANREQAEQFHALMAGVLAERKLHAQYAAQLEIDLSGVRPDGATRAYTNFLLSAAWRGPVGEIAAAMTPCMRLYAFLGAQLKPAFRDGHPYGDWIQAYSAKEFADLSRKLESLLDSTAADTPAVREAYRYALQCELDFFSAPLEANP